MNEFEKLEAELKELRPVEPSQEFTARLEKALGDAGNVAMRCLPDDPETTEAKNSIQTITNAGNLLSFPRLVGFAGLAGLGLAAVWTMVFYLSSYLAPDAPTTPDNVVPLLAQKEKDVSPVAYQDDPDSPLHGLSLDQLQDVSVMPVSGWLDPQINERFLRVVDEGVFQQPSGLPARQVRHYFIDETMWSHPASDTRILSTTPREEVILIELDTY
jgi:hypothetical protein